MKGMFDTLVNAFRVEDLRKKIFFTFGILALYQVCILVPVPGLDREIFSTQLGNLGQIGQLMNLISGGGLYSASVLAMGITPYINASIIMQLLTAAIPALERLQKEGETGRKKIQKITRYVTVGIAMLQATAFWYATRSAMTGALPEALNAILIILCFTAGTAFLMFLGELINDNGIGNGISLIIFAGIAARLPDMFESALSYSSDMSGRIDPAALGVTTGSLLLAIVGAFSVATIVFVLFIQNAERRIPVHYSKRVIGRKQYGGQNTYIPLKVNQSGVLPVIFAMSVLSLPSTVVSFFFSGSDSPIVEWFRNFSNNALYYVVTLLLIIGFTFFYSMIQFHPIEISNNLQKNGGFIPGVRPGRPTSDFIAKTAGRLNWVDGLFLSAVVLVPTLIGTITKMEHVWFAGTSVLILTGVANDLVKRIESQMVTHHYKGFLD